MTTEQNAQKFNSLLSQLQDVLMCGPECQKSKEAVRLKEQLDEARVNVRSAPSKVQSALKNFVVFTKGESTYNDLQETRFRKKAENIANNYEDKFKEHEKMINFSLNRIRGIVVNFKNIVELYLKYRRENAELMQELKKTTNDVLTNERKTYYQDQQVDALDFYYYYFILTIYIICVICFGAFSLIFPSQSSVRMRIAIFACLILLPFVGTWVLGFIIYVVYEFYNLLPKNVYKEEIDEKVGYKYFKNI
jgi:lipopolysaccharide export LptBFGC system permease protein LptF